MDAVYFAYSVTTQALKTSEEQMFNDQFWTLLAQQGAEYTAAGKSLSFACIAWDFIPCY